MTPTVKLVAGRDKSVRRRHPWIFSGAIAGVEGDPAPGGNVLVRAADGEPLGWGALSPRSQIAVRMWTFDADRRIDSAFIRQTIERAVAARAPLTASGEVDALRLVHAESDGLPGLVVDRYADFLVCQFLSAGAEHWKREVVAALADLARTQSALGPVRGIYERSDVDVRRKEGLGPAAGLLIGNEPPETVEVREFGCRFLVQIHRGHKTGFYLDQRDNRALVAQYAAGCRVLNGFAYTGAFAVWALRGGAKHVANIDTSAGSLGLASANMALNGFSSEAATNVEGDVFHVLRKMRDDGSKYDLIVLDPPKFAESRGQIERATRGYKDINLLAFKLLRPGGVLFTFSCSGLIPPDLFQKVVAGAALDSGRSIAIERWLRQAPDHRVALSFPEGEYLKGLVCRATD
jgi:23S rRNA (cytosine1962-C5)-methyltransferase